MDEVITRINDTGGEQRGVQLKLVKWERMTPKIGGQSAQKEIDQQTPDYDIFVGIMSARFGAPTEGSDSGTEHEFKAALARYSNHGRPWILFYFDENPQPKSADQCSNILSRGDPMNESEGYVVKGGTLIFTNLHLSKTRNSRYTNIH